MKIRFAILFLAVMALSGLPALANDVCQVQGNAIQNCGFETGDFTGWTLTGNTGFTTVLNSPPYVNSGDWAAYMGPVGSDGTLSQSFAGNTLMFSYRQDPSFWGLDSIVANDIGPIGNNQNLWYIQFALANWGYPANDFTVFWNGVDVGPDLVNSNSFPYTNYSGYLVGSSEPQVPPVPEPGTLVLLGTGAVSLAGMIRRKMASRM